MKYHIIERDGDMFYLGRDCAKFIRLSYDINKAKQFKDINRATKVANRLSSRSAHKFNVITLTPP